MNPIYRVACLSELAAAYEKDPKSLRMRIWRYESRTRREIMRKSGNVWLVDVVEAMKALGTPKHALVFVEDNE